MWKKSVELSRLFALRTSGERSRETVIRRGMARLEDDRTRMNFTLASCPGAILQQSLLTSNARFYRTAGSEPATLQYTRPETVAVHSQATFAAPSLGHLPILPSLPPAHNRVPGRDTASSNLSIPAPRFLGSTHGATHGSGQRLSHPRNLNGSSVLGLPWEELGLAQAPSGCALTRTEKKKVSCLLVLS